MASPPVQSKNSPRNLVSPLQSSEPSRCENLNTISFNQDSSFFACGTNQDFRIYNSDSCKEIKRRTFGTGGIGIVEILFSSNILVFVGAEGNHEYPPNTCNVYDDCTKRIIASASFKSKIRGVKLRRDLVVIVLEHITYVYKLQYLKLLNQLETLSNPKGLCAISQTSNCSVLACPGLHPGEVRVEHLGLKTRRFIQAHHSNIAFFTLTFNGHLLATAGMKGTLIRIFNTMDGTLLQEVRRGTERADIYSIALSPTAQWLAVSSDKGTVHVFGLKVQVAEDSSNINANSMSQLPWSSDLPASSDEGSVSPHIGENATFSLTCIKGMLPKYFSSEWSFAQFYLPVNTRFHVTFGKQNAIIIIGSDGSFYRCTFDPVCGGKMEQKEYSKFLDSDNSRLP